MMMIMMMMRGDDSDVDVHDNCYEVETYNRRIIIILLLFKKTFIHTIYVPEIPSIIIIITITIIMHIIMMEYDE
jgi:hypothetical protein